MKQFKLVVAFLFFATLNVLAQGGTLQVKVTESGSNKPLDLVAVQIENTTNGGTTDEKGEAKITDIPPGTYNIKFSSLGYTPKTIFEIENEPVLKKRIFKI